MSRRPPPPPRRRKQPETTLGKLRVMQAEHEREARPFDPEAPREHYARPHHFAVNSANDIIVAMARAFWVDAWASNEEEHGRRAAGPGEDLMDAAPPTPASAIHFARKFAKDFQTANDADLMELYERAAAAPGKHREEPTEDDFGHYIAMEAMGHGVTWSDDHPDHGFVVPHTEAYELALEAEADDDEEEDEDDEELQAEWKHELEAAADELANQSAAEGRSYVDDQLMIDLEKDGYDAESVIQIATFGYETAVNGDSLVEPIWYERLQLDSGGVAETWNSAHRGSRSAASLIYGWLSENGYVKCRRFGGAWPGGEETELSVEQIIGTAARVIEAEGRTEDSLSDTAIQEVAEELFGRGSETYRTSSDGDIEVWAVEVGDDEDE